MASRINRLTARMVALAKPGLHSDGGNLYLRVSPTGARSWVFVYRSKGKQRELGLGGAGPAGVGLADARVRAAEARQTLLSGSDPLEGRKAAEAARQAAATTFGSFADKYVSDHRAGWSNPKHAAQWEMTLGDAYCAKIRPLPIGGISVDQVMDVLKPVWQSRPETARRIRMRLEKVLDAAKVLGLRSGENPARWRGNLDHLLPVHAKATKRHHPALPYADVPAFVAALTQRPAMAALAFRYMILTATRTSEVLLAEWGEIDMEGKIWTIPAERMKARRLHRIPLSDAAMQVLHNVKGKDPCLVFPGQKRGRPLSNMALLTLLRRMKLGDATTAHGLRSSFRDWVAEATSYPAEVAEMALAHVVENATEAAYRRGDLFEKRKKLMQAWADYLNAPTVKAPKSEEADA